MFRRTVDTRMLGPTMGALLAAACASNPAPAGYLPRAEEAQTDVHGGWIELELRTADGHWLVVGELIALGPDSVWVLTPDGGTIVARADVVRGRLGGWDSQSGDVSRLAALGAMSTISHGYYLALTMPLWIVVGSIASHSQSRAPLIDLPDGWADLAPFARFPQGLPPGVELGSLRPKRLP